MKKFSIFNLSFVIIILTFGQEITWAQIAETSKTLTVYQKLARDIFQELVEINTTRNVGSTKASEAIAARLKAAGFRESDVQIAGPHPQHLNLVVRYRGKGSLPPVLFIGHLDVVEALRQDWSLDPFTFTEKDGYFYGRGSSDMKCEDADLIANLIRLKKEGFVPDREIIVALADGEEGGNFNGIKWLLDNRRDLIEAEYCINPDGGGGTIKNGKHLTMDIQTSEKIYIDFNLEVTNKGGHSSLPVRENAIYRMAAALTRLSNFSFPVKLNETTRMFFERSALQETGQIKADMQAVAKIPTDTDAANRLANSSPVYNSMMRTTCVATMLSAGHAENALPQTARANINCRMLPDDTPENVMATLESVIADTLVTITSKNTGTVSPLSLLRKEVLDQLEKITASMWPGVIVTPVMMTGATDGRFLRAAGIPVFGVSGMFSDINDNRAHGRDERLGVKEFYDGIEFMYRFMKALTSFQKTD